VYFSAYIPVSDSPLLPSVFTAPPLSREHRLYQADWLLRFYGFTAEEILDDANPYFDAELDPKISWALRNIDKFPIEVNKASMDEILRIPGIGTVSALRIVRQRKIATVTYEDLKKMGVVLKRAKYFLTCMGKYYGDKDLIPEYIKGKVLQSEQIRANLLPANENLQISMFEGGSYGKLPI
jgi:predicted DNA-binding helix-hairpin-helix protein